jgi:hypothetical protein
MQVQALRQLYVEPYESHGHGQAVPPHMQGSRRRSSSRRPGGSNGRRHGGRQAGAATGRVLPACARMNNQAQTGSVSR